MSAALRVMPSSSLGAGCVGYHTTLGGTGRLVCFGADPFFGRCGLLTGREGRIYLSLRGFRFWEFRKVVVIVCYCRNVAVTNVGFCSEVAAVMWNCVQLCCVRPLRARLLRLWPDGELRSAGHSGPDAKVACIRSALVFAPARWSFVPVRSTCLCRQPCTSRLRRLCPWPRRGRGRRCAPRRRQCCQYRRFRLVMIWVCTMTRAATRSRLQGRRVWDSGRPRWRAAKLSRGSFAEVRRDSLASLSTQDETRLTVRFAADEAPIHQCNLRLHADGFVTRWLVGFAGVQHVGATRSFLSHVSGRVAGR